MHFIVSLMNCGPLLVVSFLGVPKLAITSWMIICAVCLVLMVFMVGFIIVNLVNLSTITMMESYPCDCGRSITKSQVIHSTGLSGIGNGFNGPCFDFLSISCHWHKGHFAVTVQLQPEPRVNRRLQQERSLKSQQDWKCYLGAVPSQEATGGLNKRSHSRDSSKMAIRGKGNYGLTGESWHKASSLNTTTCGYVVQMQSKMETMTTCHMIESSVAHDGKQENMW